MFYVYDIVLNFNFELYDFYEWKKDDIIYHIKKIGLFLVSNNEFNYLLSNIVMFDNQFLLSIYNQCEFYANRQIDLIPYAFLLTDKYRVMAILLDSSGKTIKYSSLLLDEEEDILNLSKKLNEVNLTYQYIKERHCDFFKTRFEINIIRYIKNNIKNDLKINNLDRLRYLYFEYFNKECDDINQIFHELSLELSNDFSNKIYNLYYLIKLSYDGKNVQN